MLHLVKRYTRWLHTRWPAGTVERLPLVKEDYSTNVPGLYVVGDLTGIPLLKFAADSGAKAVQTIAGKMNLNGAKPQAASETLDLVIVGGSVSGMAAALEARKLGLRFEVIEASEPFSTIVNFPRGKPIFTYPTELKPEGDLQFTERSSVKEGLLDELRSLTIERGIMPRYARVQQVRRSRSGEFEIQLDDGATLKSRFVIVGIGRSGNFRKLNVPGEDSGKVFNRLHDPKEYAGKNVLVVGGGDSALEAAIAIAQFGGQVTLSYRKNEFSRPKPDNIEKINMLAADPMADVQIEQPMSERVTTATGEYMNEYKKPGSIQLMLGSKVTAIEDKTVRLIDSRGAEKILPNDAVFAMIGREPPLDFFRRSGVHIRGEWRVSTWISFILVLLACVFVYHWKKPGAHIAEFPPFNWIAAIGGEWKGQGWFPYNLPNWWESRGVSFADPHSILGTMKISIGDPGFFYSLAYCACVVIFGLQRIRRRKTPYVKVQTFTLMAVQVIPLFLLPYILLPWAGNNGWFESGGLKWLADQLFPIVDDGHGREYWRAFGLVLAWPLFFWNVFTEQPLMLWLLISLVQTFVIIPALIYFFGKGAYCGWICSCGALAETLGDAHRHKMPHGPLYNRLNMIGQVFLGLAFFLLLTRIGSWIWPNSGLGKAYAFVFTGLPVLNYAWFVDLLWAGIIGVGFYWHFSGRVWCRFACPLAALMHIYARFSRFRIIADKKKCISCNVCTSVCHQGIDIMNFANKGLAMEDPECVRCSACVQSCPTGVLQFGQVNRRTGEVIRTDPLWLAASPVRLRETELTINGRRIAS